MKVWAGANREGLVSSWCLVHDDGRREIVNTSGNLLVGLPRTGPLRGPANSSLKDTKFVRSRLGYAERHPRMFRGDRLNEGPLGVREYQDVWNLSRAAFQNLCRDMTQLFRLVEPDAANAKKIYGHEIRNLLALACMEVESSCKAVLKANNYRPGVENLSTKDYVKLLKPLRLAEYKVTLPAHRKIPAFRPFASWKATLPTKSLPWYDAYNGTKHDRENNFKTATLWHMIQAMGAAHVMMLAQFGHCGARGVGLDGDDFYAGVWPTWSAKEIYVPPKILTGNSPWRDVPYPF